MFLPIRGNIFFFHYQQAKMKLVDRKWPLKSTLFTMLTPVFWQFWLKKSFSGIFHSCFGIV